MAFPDRIERTLDLPHPPAKVWAALTTVEGLGTWFGNRASGEVAEGALIHLAWDEESQTAQLRVERLDEPVAFGFTWHVYGLEAQDPRRTYVEFTLEAAGEGTRLTVVESGFAQLAEDEYRKAYDGNVGGWKHELGDLAAYLDAA